MKLDGSEVAMIRWICGFALVMARCIVSNIVILRSYRGISLLQ